MHTQRNSETRDAGPTQTSAGHEDNPHARLTLIPNDGVEASAGYSLTAPAARPDCQYFCRARNAITRGMIVISEPVITRFWIA